MSGSPAGQRPRPWRPIPLLVIVAALVTVAAVGTSVWTTEEASWTVVVADTLGMSPAYTAGTPHEAGGPVCANCPAQAAPGATVTVTIWLDWACRTGGACTVEIQGLTVAPPFRWVAGSPSFPLTLSASTPASTPPGNGNWSSGWTVFAVELESPRSPGTYTLGGTVLLSAPPTGNESA